MAVDVVIGAGSGMGRAVAVELAGRGPLVVADVDRARLEEVAEALRSSGGDVTVVECDLADVTSLESLAAVARERGPLGALVVTGGVSPQQAAGPRILDVNLAGTARALKCFRSDVTAGSVAVCFASIGARRTVESDAINAALDDPLGPDLEARLRRAGLDVDDPRAAYAYSKLGVMRLCRRQAAIWGPAGGRVLSLSPGVIETPMGRAAVEASPHVGAMVAASPLGREGRAEEVAAVVAFLCSPAASFMTGSDVLVDGGAVDVARLDPI